MSSDFPCSFCTCNFVSKRDLDRHLDAFPGPRSRHLEKLRAVHGFPAISRAFERQPESQHKRSPGGLEDH
jgi:hypothetical protein